MLLYALTHVQSVTSLNLSNNGYGPKGAKEIAHALPYLTRLKRLKITGNTVCTSGAEVLRSVLSSPACSVTELNSVGPVEEDLHALEWAPIGLKNWAYESAMVIKQVGQCDRLQSLDLTTVPCVAFGEPGSDTLQLLLAAVQKNSASLKVLKLTWYRSAIKYAPLDFEVMASILECTPNLKELHVFRIDKAALTVCRKSSADAEEFERLHLVMGAALLQLKGLTLFKTSEGASFWARCHERSRSPNFDHAVPWGCLEQGFDTSEIVLMVLWAICILESFVIGVVALNQTVDNGSSLSANFLIAAVAGPLLLLIYRMTARHIKQRALKEFIRQKASSIRTLSE